MDITISLQRLIELFQENFIEKNCRMKSSSLNELVISSLSSFIPNITQNVHSSKTVLSGLRAEIKDLLTELGDKVICGLSPIHIKSLESFLQCPSNLRKFKTVFEQSILFL